MLPRLRPLPFAVALLTAAGCQQQAPIVLPAPAAGIVLDGQLSPDEWGEAGDVRLRADEEFVYVGVRGNAAQPVHLYLATPAEVHVLHASGALGRAVYEHDGEAGWRLARPFEWEVRDPRFGRPAPEVEAERARYLQRHGWAANTVLMGEPGHVEFKVERAYFERQGEHVAVSYLWLLPDSTSEIRHWPREAAVAPDEEPLLMGHDAPAEFLLRGWFTPGPRGRAG